MLRVVSSTSAASRLDAARRFLSGRPPAEEIVIAGASRGAADDLARAIARDAGATFGLHRFSLTELAARAAVAAMDGGRRAPGSQAGTEAIAARAVFDALGAGELEYFTPVASLPGFPKALARTLWELRLAGILSERLIDQAGPKGPALQMASRPGPFGPGGTAASRPGPFGPGAALQDIGRLLAHFERQLDAAVVDDRAALFRLAATVCRAGRVRWASLRILLLDVPLDSRAEQEFVSALVGRSPDVLATAPAGDHFALRALAAMDGRLDTAPDEAPADSDLGRLRQFIFERERPRERARTGDVTLFSAPGEGREAVEIVRRILDEAAGGVPFDEMAVFLRAPQQYLGLLEHACARGDVPVYFDRGTRRPDPAGRAFVALLSCAVEGLSAKRFDEYLSLGQVPRVGEAPDNGLAAGPQGPALQMEPDSDDEAVVAGTLRSPWKWEELIVESAVVGGRTRSDGAARWRRRLDGLDADYAYRIAELEKEEPESARIARFRRDRRNLKHLRQFALPIVDALAEWPTRATWGEWLDRFSALATRALWRPARVLQTLVDLRPMAAVGPVTLEEARDVLHDRLVTLDWDPPARRYGCVFVGTPHQARGRVFRVVFVPGLAERVVPQRPREDPLLLDDSRGAVDVGLVDQKQRGDAERLLLKIAIGAARERLYLSYPRLDVGETRARVPSFYALDVMRAITGRVPDHRVLASEAADEGGASLAWPAPKDPDRAIDDLEHDLATLKPLLESRDVASVKGHAHYMLGLNEALRRSVISRWARGRPAWASSDGLIKVAPGTQSAIDANRLNARPYSLSALQRFATCPYQFLLATIYRLEPWDEPEPLVRMDPLTRGSLFHKVQAEFYRAMQSANALPITRAALDQAIATLDRVLGHVAADYAERLAPAIDRIWRDEIGEIRRDLGIWVQKLADDPTWVPAYFEFSFGLADEGRDPRSLKDPITIDGRFVLRGSVDLIEHHPQLDVLRVTDHKTGRNRSTPGLIVGGGATLQPVLYSVAIEQGLGKKVFAGRLFYATTAGGFIEHEIPINDYTRGQGLQVLTIIDRAVELGLLPAAPAERACTWCDFRPVCGPREEERVRHKAQDKVADLMALRSMR
ncbi:MAG: PD-(D/E)XK nuclease family protein [Acidobacteria bacterium]|nr:PD-(D/E)XK nuclease family protein [Acidobacteriota bacterium]